MKLQKAGNKKGVENLMLASGNGNGGEEGVFINFYSEIVDSPDLSSGNWVRLGEHSAADIDHWSMFLKSFTLLTLLLFLSSCSTSLRTSSCTRRARCIMPSEKSG